MSATQTPLAPAHLLTPQECAFLDRQVRNTGRYAVFTAVDLCVALALAIWSVVDGALGAELLGAFKQFIEEPVTMLV